MNLILLVQKQKRRTREISEATHRTPRVNKHSEREQKQPKFELGKNGDTMYIEKEKERETGVKEYELRKKRSKSGKGKRGKENKLLDVKNMSLSLFLSHFR